jgi:hypothetical protein
MKTKDEIQKAHDLLCALLLSDERPVDEITQADLECLVNAFCWVLQDGHPPAEHVQKLLDAITKNADELGVKFERVEPPARAWGEGFLHFGE